MLGAALVLIEPPMVEFHLPFVTRFEAAKLDDAWIAHSLLKRTTFRDASMRCATIFDNIIEGADFGGADLTNARFVKDDLSSAVGMDTAILSNACALATRLPDGIQLPRCSQQTLKMACPAPSPEQDTVSGALAQ